MILDEVRETLPKNSLKSFDELIKKATIVKAHNISDYYYENVKDYWGPEDFPNVAPPWPNIWIEWNMPSNWLTDKPPDELPSYFKTIPVKKGVWRIYAANKDYAACHMIYEEVEWLNEIGARWMVHVSYYRGSMPGCKYLLTQTFFITPEGKITFVKSSDVVSVNKVINYLQLDVSDKEREPEEGKFFIPTIMSERVYGASQDGIKPDISCYDIAFLTISFCHCKNVTAKRDVIDDKLRKKRRESNKVDITKSYTLNILPIKQILKQQGEADQTGIQRALHICRGQFKDYTEGAGLFGKHHGIYFFPMHVRGLASKGTIQKHYQIRL